MAEDADQATPAPHSEWRQGDFALGVGSFLFGDIPEDADEGGIGAFFDEKDPGVCQRSCPVISCGDSDFRVDGFVFWVEPDVSSGLPVADFA